MHRGDRWGIHHNTKVAIEATYDAVDVVPIGRMNRKDASTNFLPRRSGASDKETSSQCNVRESSRATSARARYSHGSEISASSGSPAEGSNLQPSAVFLVGVTFAYASCLLPCLLDAEHVETPQSFERTCPVVVHISVGMPYST